MAKKSRFAFLKDFIFSKNKAFIIIGLKISKTQLKAVSVERFATTSVIQDVVVEPLESSPDKLTEQLSAIFSRPSFRKGIINTSVSGSDIIVRFIKYPSLSKKELKRSLQFEAEKYIPFNLSEVRIDYHILENFQDPSKKQMSLALVAARKTLLDDVIMKCQKAHVRLNAIDIDAFSIFNILSKGYPQDVSKRVAVLNVGGNQTTLLVVENNEPAFIRDLVFGGEDITKYIQDKMNISFDEATSFKKSLDFSILDNIETIKEALSYLFDEIKLSFDFYIEHHAKPEEKIEKIFLLGGGISFEGIGKVFAEVLQLPCEVVDPTKFFEKGSHVDQKLLAEFSSQLAIPLGLTLRD